MIELYNGDCLEVMKNIKDKSVDLIITSPPYYNAKDYSHWDTYESYIQFLKDVFKMTYSKLKDGRMCCVNISTIIEPRIKRSSESKRIPLPFHFVNLMEEIGFKFLEDIIWVKPEGSAKNRNGQFYQHRKPLTYKPNIVNEYIFVFQKPTDRLIDKILKSYDKDTINNSLIKWDYERSNVWYINAETHSDHPAPFPLKIPTKLIEYYSFVDDIIIDCFMGSGTTGVACKNTNRNFIGIELDKNYFEIAKSRIENTVVNTENKENLELW